MRILILFALILLSYELPWHHALAQSFAPATAPETLSASPLAESEPSLESSAEPLELLPLAEEASVIPDLQPVTNPQDSPYHAKWAQDSVRILQENGIALPQGINYDVLIGQADFVRVLAHLSAMSPSQLQAHLLPTETVAAGRLSRGEAIHLLLASFGLTESLPTFAQQPSKFTDLQANHPAYAAIVLAESLHLINGYPDRSIRPDEALSWGEALILAETVYSWRKALPTTAPEWVKAHEKRQNMWFQLMDGFRLLLTLAYIGLALYFLVRTWLKTRHRKNSPYRGFSLGLGLVTLLMGTLWISELLFNYHVIPREVYAGLAMLSVFVGLYLLKLGSDLDGEISKPKPQVVIDMGYVESINHERGELFIRDKLNDSHSLALVSPDSKVLRKSGSKAVESAFLSEIQTGDVISLRAGRLEHESLLEVERITLLESRQQNQTQNQNQQSIQDYTQTEQSATQPQYLHRRPPGQS